MATNETNSVVPEAGTASTQPELLVSAVLHLMSHYNANMNETGVCVKLASVIERHLKALAGLPDLAPVLRATCQQLAEQWAAVVERGLPQPQRQPFFSRLSTGLRSV
ncbi:MAG: hypothetical protein A3I66_23715 [Burkholderiales bacterium RIFCSPLOWO2_02_FULL_57_36]|nr:MAG: hypothetical protein A3I66_23715 [Burkholderiales bacterium RIFCSPLOWO2_02_FULL_57_36]